ncbi:winged helix-turn-helix transcriptional regulator [Dialister succinatiphilus]|jgi:DNA-binding HxlR family transcriptional regulator|uniref:winged helix-turn-helix transcriptional regulator n=1 Tax=Dialister succinatiphilus TaxID=487173 RepID=UPI002356050B|nr:helix-turn-helix domain-containing protein [Dialister succinatiphilus]MCI6031010.1 helix-turn-helix transcriptional regulator [Dialister succinatiphilus]
MTNELFGICPFVTAQKLLQGKWAILILHALNEGTKRFNELERDIQITHATLSSQLKYMEKEGLVHRTVYPEVPPRVEYSLTAMGRRFAPVLDSIQVWGEEYIEFLKENRI